MRVFNLTDKVISFRGKELPPFGSLEIPMSFIPERDMMLQKANKLAFGSLPKGWKRPEAPVESTPEVPKLRIGTPVVVEKAAVLTETLVSEQPSKEPQPETKEEKIEHKKDFSKKR